MTMVVLEGIVMSAESRKACMREGHSRIVVPRAQRSIALPEPNHQCTAKRLNRAPQRRSLVFLPMCITVQAYLTALASLPYAPLRVRRNILFWVTVTIWIHGSRSAAVFPVHIWVGLTSVTIPFLFLVMLIALLANVFFLEIEAFFEVKRPITATVRAIAGFVNSLCGYQKGD